jgi:3-oxoacyl-[acyl-carrier-protein] synthase II
MNGPRLAIGVSGIGLITPLGASREESWKNLIAGKTAIRETNEGLEARVIDFSSNGARSRMGDFALRAAKEALAHAGFLTGELRRFTIGCVIGQSKPVLPAFPTFSFSGWSANDVVKRELLLSGPSINLVAACATGVAAIKAAVDWLCDGVCDVVLAGATESSLNEFYRTGFQQMGVLATGEPSNVTPFGRQRSGFAMGEGAAVMVLERLQHIRSRGAKPLAIVENAALGQNASDSIKSSESGHAVARLVYNALHGRSVDYINAHGTATKMNDLAETRGIRLALGAKAYETKISSTKAATGHLLGAAGAVEAVFAALALRDQIVPPTLHLTNPDPACDLDYVPNVARKDVLVSSLSLSYGFGGQMGGVYFTRSDM